MVNSRFNSHRYLPQEKSGQRGILKSIFSGRGQETPQPVPIVDLCLREFHETPGAQRRKVSGLRKGQPRPIAHRSGAGLVQNAVALVPVQASVTSATGRKIGPEEPTRERRLLPVAELQAPLNVVERELLDVAVCPRSTLQKRLRHA